MINLCEIITCSLDVNVRSYSVSDQLFICRTHCNQRLKKFKRALDNLVEAKHKLQEVFNANLHRAKRMRSEEEIVIDDNVNE